MLTFGITRMARNKLHSDSWVAQLRLAGVDGAPLATEADIIGSVDATLRRAISLRNFVVRVHNIPSRNETVALIAASRRSSTDRADCAVLHLLRRLFPAADKGVWRTLPKEVSNSKVGHYEIFVDYRIVEAEELEAEIARLRDSSKFPGTSVLATSEEPSRAPRS